HKSVLIIFDWSSIELAKKSRSVRDNALRSSENVASKMFEFPERLQVVFNAGLRQCPLITGKQSFCLRLCILRTNQTLAVCVPDRRFEIANPAIKNLLYLFAKHLVLGTHLAPHA